LFKSSFRLNYSGESIKEQAWKSSFVRFSEQKFLRGELLRIIVGVTGASGALYGYRLLEKLRRDPQIETHLILSRAAERTAYLECGKSSAEFKALAHHTYPVEDIGSRLASGSYLTDGMVIAPCSIHSMSAIASGISSNLLIRAADVCLKERRKLILMVRESPLHLGHLRTMVALTEMGAVIAPPSPGFYNNPQTITDIVDHSVDRVLDLLHLPAADARRWDGGSRAQRNQTE
jgi:4-hydroxy-3-polyprenylbenzoate decarboxylase